VLVETDARGCLDLVDVLDVGAGSCEVVCVSSVSEINGGRGLLEKE